MQERARLTPGHSSPPPSPAFAPYLAVTGGSGLSTTSVHRRKSSKWLTAGGRRTSAPNGWDTGGEGLSVFRASRRGGGRQLPSPSPPPPPTGPKHKHATSFCHVTTPTAYHFRRTLVTWTGRALLPKRMVTRGVLWRFRSVCLGAKDCGRREWKPKSLFYFRRCNVGTPIAACHVTPRDRRRCLFSFSMGQSGQSLL